MNSPHLKTTAVENLEADPQSGLTQEEAGARLERFGPNELLGPELPPALKALSASKANVLRDGRWAEIPARELVPGDVLRVEPGDALPADLRWIETEGLHVQESALTGGSEPVEKQAGTDDRRGRGYMGMLVTSGSGVAVTTATGMQTELGRIAAQFELPAGEKPAWRKRMAGPLTWLGVGFILALMIVLVVWLRGGGLPAVLQSALVAAAAVLPLSLPALAFLTLRQGARRMAARGARVRSLSAVERLGSITVICSDQTGTLTENRMTVAVMDVAGHALDLMETMDRSGSFAAARGLPAPAQSALSLTAMGAALCNDATLMEIDEGRFHTVGDATDGALVTAAASLGYWKSALDASFPRVAALPFDSERKRMTTVHDLFEYDPTILAGLKIGIRRYIAFTKGSVDGLLGLSTSVWVDEAAQPMDAELKTSIQAAQVRLMQKGMRVLGVAFRLLDELPASLEDGLEQDLTFLGLFGMVDPPRPEVPEALERMKAAGIRTLMLTRDAPLAAFETARQLGILDMPAAEPTLKRVMTGAQLERLSDEELERSVEDVRVFARLAPIQKLKIVQALQRNGQVVSITGDGVSDAPALRRADIGAAMGLGGTQVSKEAADLVLLDDNFAALAGAVEEGRRVQSLLRRLGRFLAAGNLSRLFLLLLANLLGMPLLLPLQLLWLSVVTDGLLGLGLSLETPPGSMNRPREKADFTYSAAWQAVGIGLLTAALAISAYFTGRAAWESVTFTFLGFAQIAHLLAARSRRIPFLSFGLLALVFALQLAALYFPPLAQLLGLVPPTSLDLSFALVSGALVFTVLESVRRALHRMEALPRRN